MMLMRSLAQLVTPQWRRSSELESADEMVAAHERAVKDRKAHDPGPPLEPGPFAQVVGILERLHKGGLLGESGSTLA